MEFIRKAAQQNIDPEYVKAVAGISEELMGKAYMDKYTLDELIEMFEKHAIEREKIYKEDKEKYPNNIFPHDGFNISKALYSICCELEYMSRQISDLQ